jgi:hypothetical protein
MELIRAEFYIALARYLPSKAPDYKISEFFSTQIVCVSFASCRNRNDRSAVTLSLVSG